MNGKMMEIAVKNILNGRDVMHLETLANPDSLKQFYDIAKMHF